MTAFRTKQIKKTLTVLAFLSLWIIGFSVLFVFSIGQSIWYSLTNYNIMNEPRWLGFTNYLKLFFEDDVFWISLTNTLFFVAILVPGVLLSSLFFASLRSFAAFAYKSARTPSR